MRWVVTLAASSLKVGFLGGSESVIDWALESGGDCDWIEDFDLIGFFLEVNEKVVGFTKIIHFKLHLDGEKISHCGAGVGSWRRILVQSLSFGVHALFFGYHNWKVMFLLESKLPCWKGTRDILCPWTSPVSWLVHSTQLTINVDSEKRVKIPGYKIKKEKGWWCENFVWKHIIAEEKWVWTW